MNIFLKGSQPEGLVKKYYIANTSMCSSAVQTHNVLQS